MVSPSRQAKRNAASLLATCGCDNSCMTTNLQVENPRENHRDACTFVFLENKGKITRWDY